MLVTSCFGAGILLNVAQYYWIADWQLIMPVCHALPCLLAVITTWQLIEDTPICLVMRYSPEKACQSFNRIASLNNSPSQDRLTSSDIITVRKQHQQSLAMSPLTQLHTFSVLDLLRYRSLRTITIVTVLLMLSNTINYFAPPLMLGELGFGLFGGGVVLGVACLLHYPLCFLLIPRCPRSTMTQVFFATAALSAVGLFKVWTPTNPPPHALLLLFLFYFAVACLSTLQTIYHSELFPGLVRVMGTTLANFIKGIMVVFLPNIMASWEEVGFNRMMLFGAASFFGFAISHLLL